MTDLPGWLKHATVWLLLAVAVFVGVQAWQAQQSAPTLTAEGGVVELRRGADGHYHWPGSIDGRAVDFLVDTGATGTALPAALAAELGLPAIGRVRSATAGGTVDATLVTGTLVLQGGVRAERLKMAALPGLRAPLLGMDVLGRLHWQQDAGVLRFDLRGAAP